MTKRKAMPSKAAILEYWGPILVEDGHVPCMERLRSQFDETHYCCFACGIASVLQRAHIVPYVATQDNSVENLHLLCLDCHHDSEQLSGNSYWAWFSARKYDELEALTTRFLRRHGFATMEAACRYVVERCTDPTENFSVLEATQKLLKEGRNGLPLFPLRSWNGDLSMCSLFPRASGA